MDKTGDLVSVGDTEKKSGKRNEGARSQMIGENVVSGYEERMVSSIGRQVLGGNPISASVHLPSIQRRRPQE